MSKLKKDLMPNRIKRAKKELTKLSHDFIRHRDSTKVMFTGFETLPEFPVPFPYEPKIENILGGNCFDCGKVTSGQNFQCGHWIPDSVGGALLRYHPENMHGQASSCNCGYQQEFVKINYTRAMYQKYGEKRCNELLALKNRSIKADIIWYEKMIELYQQGDEKAIVDFLEK